MLLVLGFTAHAAPAVCLQVSAAREAIGDADFFLVARTDARGVNAKYGLEVSGCEIRIVQLRRSNSRTAQRHESQHVAPCL
jgi:hypothetical protein